MAFKLGGESRQMRSSSNTPIFSKKLEDGVVAEANMDGSIFVSEDVDPNSLEYKIAIVHEEVHLEQMQPSPEWPDGRAAYGDNWVTWEGKTYFRKNGYIDGPNGRWEEGDENHPWEQEAIAAEQEALRKGI